MKKVLLIIIVCAILLSLSFSIMFLKLAKKEPWEKKVAVVKLQGIISTAEPYLPETVANPEEIKSLIKKAEENPSVRAILIEINSPGGSPVASEEIAMAINETEKPTVAWIGEIGASGAYWIASYSDKIVAHPLSITGSIGAYTIVSELEGLFKKLGISQEIVKSGEFKDIGMPYRNVTEEEREILQEMVDTIYERFVSDVSLNRNLSLNFTYNISDGRPFLGQKAYEYGLVDQLGSRKDAIRLAGQLGGIEGEPKTVTYEAKRGFLSDIIYRSFSALGYGIGKALYSFSLTT